MSRLYSDLKPAWHLERLQELRDTGQTVPAQIQLIISDLCNHDCDFCAYRMEGYTSNQLFSEVTPTGVVRNPNRMIPESKCVEILDDASALGVGAIQFTGGGEPTVHPHHLEIFRHAQDLGLETALVTNGCLFRRGWESVIPHMKWVRVSVDAGVASTYASIRGVKESVYDRMLGNVSRLVDEVRDQGTGCVVGTSFIVTHENVAEIVEATQRVKETGVSYIRFGAIFTPENEAYYSGVEHETIKRAVDAARVLETAEFRVVDMFGSRLEDLAQHAPDYRRCGYQHFNCYIGGDLNIYRCCNTAYNRKGLIGSLKGKRLIDFWGSKQKRDAYKNFDARSCERCAFNDKNRLIDYIVSSEPVHVNFA